MSGPDGIEERTAYMDELANRPDPYDTYDDVDTGLTREEQQWAELSAVLIDIVRSQKRTLQ